jgi:hypothetical protein
MVSEEPRRRRKSHFKGPRGCRKERSRRDQEGVEGPRKCRRGVCIAG